MKNRERIIVYFGLAAALLLGLTAPRGRPVQAVAGASAAQSALGPAESLTLVGEDTSAELVLRNRDGRLSWSEHAGSRALSIGFVHVGRAIGPLMEGERYTEEYDRLEAEIREQDEAIAQRIVAFEQENKDVNPDDPQAPQLWQTYQMMRQELEQWRIEGNRRLGLLRAQQLERAYRELLAAVELVAERRDVDIVFRFIPPEADFEAVNPPQAYTGIRGRIALRYPPKLDLTDEVLEALALPVE